MDRRKPCSFSFDTIFFFQSWRRRHVGKVYFRVKIRTSLKKTGRVAGTQDDQLLVVCGAARQRHVLVEYLYKIPVRLSILPLLSYISFQQSNWL